MSASIPAHLKRLLDEFDTEKEYSGSLPKIQSTSGRTYFVKEGQKSEYEQFLGEAESLKAINIAAPGLAPHVYTHGTTEDGKAYFVSEYKDLGQLTTTAAEELAMRLATELHQLKGLRGFGFEVPTYCGPTRFPNGWYSSWELCYGAMYQHLVDMIREKGGHEKLCQVGDQIVKQVIPRLLGSLVIQPVLLHGDLWSGNVGVDKSTRKAIVYDPSSYYGHNEAELSIARMFGGFPKVFFDTYFKHHPITQPVEEYQLRGDLYESFHYLNHTLIFGGYYAAQAETKMNKLLEAINKQEEQGSGDQKVKKEILAEAEELATPAAVN